MSAVSKLIAAVLGIVFFILNSLKKIINVVTGKKEKRIGELHFQPTAVVTDGFSQQVNYSPGYQASSSNEWNTWTDKSFGVESKIEEYRRRQQEQLQKKKSKEPQEPDYFNDLRPDIRAAKRLDIHNPGHSAAPRKNLFEFNENDIQLPQINGTELGELDLDSGNQEAGAWDAEMDLNEVDQVYRAQKQKEREERQKQRLLEHERRLQQKKMKV